MERAEMRREPDRSCDLYRGRPDAGLGVRLVGDRIEARKEGIMDRYFCEECGHVATEDELDYYEERDTGEGGYGNVMYSLPLCPECGSEDLIEAKECPICGEWHGNDDVICDPCTEDIRKAWSELLAKFPDHADECEIVRYIGEVIL